MRLFVVGPAAAVVRRAGGRPRGGTRRTPVVVKGRGEGRCGVNRGLELVIGLTPSAASASSGSPGASLLAMFAEAEKFLDGEWIFVRDGR